MLNHLIQIRGRRCGFSVAQWRCRKLVLLRIGAFDGCAIYIPRHFRRFVRSRPFQFQISVVIALFCLIFCFQTEHESKFSTLMQSCREITHFQDVFAGKAIMQMAFVFAFIDYDFHPIHFKFGSHLIDFAIKCLPPNDKWIRLCIPLFNPISR